MTEAGVNPIKLLTLGPFKTTSLNEIDASEQNLSPKKFMVKSTPTSVAEF
jgi:hypothetical protein